MHSYLRYLSPAVLISKFMNTCSMSKYRSECLFHRLVAINMHRFMSIDIQGDGVT